MQPRKKQANGGYSVMFLNIYFHLGKCPFLKSLSPIDLYSILCFVRIQVPGGINRRSVQATRTYDTSFRGQLTSERGKRMRGYRHNGSNGLMKKRNDSKQE